MEEEINEQEYNYPQKTGNNDLLEQYDDYEEVPQDSISSIDTFVSLSNSAMDLVSQWKEAEILEKKMDTELQAYFAKLDNDITRLNINAPIVREQLEQINNKMDKMLDHLLAMDTDTDKQMEMKFRMLDSIDKYTDQISSLMAKILQS